MILFAVTSGRIAKREGDVLHISVEQNQKECMGTGGYGKKNFRQRPVVSMEKR
jgi:hypothetical protein